MSRILESALTPEQRAEADRADEQRKALRHYTAMAREAAATLPKRNFGRTSYSEIIREVNTMAAKYASALGPGSAEAARQQHLGLLMGALQQVCNERGSILEAWSEFVCDHESKFSDTTLDRLWKDFGVGPDQDAAAEEAQVRAEWESDYIADQMRALKRR